MSITCACPKCGKRLKAADSAAGKKAKCPDCGAAVPIPAKKSKKPAADDEEFDLQKLNIEAGIEGPIEEEQIACPMCGEMTRANASKCRYCGEDLNRIRKPKKKRPRVSSEDDMTVSDYVICILCSQIACIASVIYLIQGKPKAVKMLAISFGMSVFWNGLVFIVKMMQAQP